MRYLFIITLLFLQSCSTYMENKIGEEFKSIQPDYTNFEMVDTSTAVALFMLVVADFLPPIEELMLWEILLQLL